MILEPDYTTTLAVIAKTLERIAKALEKLIIEPEEKKNPRILEEKK